MGKEKKKKDLSAYLEVCILGNKNPLKKGKRFKKEKPNPNPTQ